MIESVTSPSYICSSGWVGNAVGAAVGVLVGAVVGSLDGAVDGSEVGFAVGSLEGDRVDSVAIGGTGTLVAIGGTGVTLSRSCVSLDAGSIVDDSSESNSNEVSSPPSPSSSLSSSSKFAEVFGIKRENKRTNQPSFSLCRCHEAAEHLLCQWLEF